MNIAQVDFHVDFHTLALCLAVVILWSVLRPASIRDYDGRRLPNNPLARFLYSLICVFAYLSLVAAFAVLGPAFVDAANHAISVPFIEAYRDKAPVLGLVVLGAIMQFSFFRDIDRSTLIWLHSARHLYRDGQELIEHLRKCRFNPSVGESEHNRALALRFGIQIEPDNVTVALSDAMQRWSKVATLTRLVRDWNKNDLTRVLSTPEMTELEQVERAHERKTQVIIEIIRLIDDTNRGAISPELLKSAVRAIGNVDALDQLSQDELSARLKSIVGDAGGSSKRPIRMTLSDLRYDFSKVESYFREEYDLLLDTISALAARSVVLSGDAGPKRLEILKDAGFGGIGRLEVISFDRVLWLFVSVAFFGFIILAAGNSGGEFKPEQAEGLARFAFTMAIATLIGSIVGSHRRFARADETPWTTYLAAGAFAGLALICVNYGVILFKSAVGLTLSENQKNTDLSRLLPWTLLPIFVTIAVCRLGRLQRWPISGPTPLLDKAIQRCADGIAISAVLLLAFLGAYYAHILFGLELPKGLQDRMASLPNRVMPVPIFWPLQALGFLIGAVAVQDVRRAAHTRVVAQGTSTIDGYDPWQDKLVTSSGPR